MQIESKSFEGKSNDYHKSDIRLVNPFDRKNITIIKRKTQKHGDKY